jgi:hypothetical protein
MLEEPLVFMLEEHPPPDTPLSAKLANVDSTPEAVLIPMTRIRMPIGAPCPTASAPVVVTLKLLVAVEVAEFDSVALLPVTELMVVPEGMPLPLTASPDATVLGKFPEIVTVEEPCVSEALTIRRFGPRLVS